ncbi:nodulation protein NodZ [Vibrio cholerae]|uniref:nodulation protein NodZ n=1 Tax=Vibrio cholerae TaxID=666 RepID=UPI0004E38613|nr:nodulation protein NodZ [Vibrio cholerae]EGR1088995.1 glycosyltransferase [Vibrio cholerae]KFE23491.1 glycosyl transferases group 1 family protein [Vibrio cholerae]TXZ28693.1 glycosyltransferase [Vibrio cholerae]BCK27010.1 hypothetical protein VCSRO77_0340 [Vibrio cholerae]BCN21480.1 putative glycosyltransferase [Vibrio cholerae]
MVSVNVVSRFDSNSGIGRHGWTVIKTLSLDNDINLTAVVTDRNISKLDKIELGKYVSNISYLHDDVETADIAIFCDVFGQYNTEQLRPLGYGVINYDFVVFDSSSIPSEWVRYINNHSDGVVTPSDFIRESCISSGVNKDIFVLPLIVDEIDRIALSSNELMKKQNKIRFGIVSSYEDRKNIELLLESFEKCNFNNAELFIQISYSHKLDDSLIKLKQKYSKENIVILTGTKSKQFINELYNSFDILVSLSRGEGFSLVPREFMSLGRPIILSDTGAHSEIPSMEGLYFVPCDIPYPAYYPQIDDSYHGIQMSPYIDDVIPVFKKAYNDFLSQKLNGNDLINYRKKFTPTSLFERYASLFNPRVVYNGAKSILSRKELNVMDQDLYKKYIELGFDTEASTKQVVLMNDAGFFSIFNRFISILRWETKNDINAVVVPDWRVSALKEDLGHTKFTSFCYGNESDGNLFLKFFEPLDYPEITPELYNSDDFLSCNSIVRKDFNEKLEPDLTYVHAYKLYHRSDFYEWRCWYHDIIKQHIHLRPEIANRINSIKSDYFDGYYVIGAHVRHPSHAIEQLSGVQAENEKFVIKIKERIDKLSREGKDNIRVFLATDQDLVVKHFKDEFSDKLIWMEATRTTKEQDDLYNSLSKVEREREGFQLQHIMANDPEKWSTDLAVEVIQDAWLLAACNVFYHTTSNVSTAVSFINPEVEMIYCE